MPAYTLRITFTDSDGGNARKSGCISTYFDLPDFLRPGSSLEWLIHNRATSKTLSDKP